MDCKTARLLFDLDRPGELDPAATAALRGHLDLCPDCQALADADRQFDEAVGPVMLAVPEPEGLRLRLLGRLDRQRDAFYRRLLTRAAAVAAAAVLVAALGWYGTRSWWRAALDLEDIRAGADAKQQASPDQVNAWLHDVGGPGLAAPPDFRYALLADYRLATLQGHRVPMLLFLRGDRDGLTSFAEVYVLSGERFDLAALDEQYRQQLRGGSIPGPQVTVRSHPQPGHENLRYLVVYTGLQVDTFLEGRGGRRPEAH